MSSLRLWALVALTMVAFAANSVLNRLALVEGGSDAVAFGTVRLLAGAAILWGLVLWQQGRLRLSASGKGAGVAALCLYIFGFSWAYLSLDAGLGALILFGMVQATMFTGALIGGERPGVRRWAGAGLALGGLAWLLWPTGPAPISLPHGLAMAAAGIGWGLYSLIGRGAANALQATAANFVLAAPVGLVVWLLVPGAGGLTGAGVALAVTSGAITSSLGYALWYALLPRLSASAAGVAQLTVPVIALAGGVVFLAEPVTLRFALASLLVLGGVALSLRRA